MNILTDWNNVLMITFSVVYIIDHSGMIQSLSKWLWEKIKKEEWRGQLISKPFSCSLCSSFWLVLAYLLINGQTIIQSFCVAVIASICSVFLSRVLSILLTLINRIHL